MSDLRLATVIVHTRPRAGPDFVAYSRALPRTRRVFLVELRPRIGSSIGTNMFLWILGVPGSTRYENERANWRRKV